MFFFSLKYTTKYIGYYCNLCLLLVKIWEDNSPFPFHSMAWPWCPRYDKTS